MSAQKLFVENLFPLCKIDVKIFQMFHTSSSFIDVIISNPFTFNDENIVALFDNKLYELISYIPELLFL